MSDIRQQILDGKLTLPDQDWFRGKFGNTVTKLTQNMFASAFANYLKNKGTISTIDWIEKYPDVKVFNQVLKVLSDNNWLHTNTTPARHWSEAYMPEDKLLSYVTPDELAEVRASKKFYKYIPGFKIKDECSLTRVNRQIKQTGLQRIGMMKAANSQFYYDTAKLTRYKEHIITNTNKGMRKCRELKPEMAHDIASYDEVATDIVNQLSKEPVLMTMEGNVSDSRGRAIKGALSKIANPIGYKDFRASLVIPE